jgi:hypothetical protein
MPNQRRMRHVPTRGLASLAAIAAGVLLTACAGENADETGGSGGTAPTTGGGGSGGTPVVAGGGGAGGGTGGQGGTGGAPAGGMGGTGEGGMGGMPPNNCGNGVLDDGEQCEGNDFGGKTCATFGLSGGTLQCNPFCGIVVSFCTPLEQCFDGFDNDEDGLTDCADDECTTELACTDPCAVAFDVPVPYFESGDIAGSPDVLSSSCAPNGGPETLVAVQAGIDGDMSANAFSGFDGVLSIRTACNDPATEIACIDNQGANGQESVSFPVTAGTVYYVIFEAKQDGAVGFYNLDVQQLLPEAWCSGQWDDDQDGFVDCDDPTSCKGIDFNCAPGASPYGSNCFQNSNCAATGGDPICLDFNQGFNNGYCSEFCDGPGDCAGDGVCVDLDISFHGVCLDGCVNTSDCPPGTSCVDSGNGQMVCYQPPELNCLDYADNDSDGLTDCQDPSGCAASFACQGGILPAGSPCSIHQECESNDNDPFCIDQFHEFWPGGYCSQYCDMATNDCPAGSVCGNNFVANAPICLQTCTGPADCRPGYFCNFDGTCIF